MMLTVVAAGFWLMARGRLDQAGWYLRLCQLTSCLGFIAVIAGWTTTEVGRQPWTVYAVLRTADAMTPFLTARAAMTSLLVFCAVYSFIFAFGTLYIYRLLRAGPAGNLVLPPVEATPNRPMSVVKEPLTPGPRRVPTGE
jgi:cytochrome d ubiquinol oxidase subunit I